jgi:hypothetical protein
MTSVQVLRATKWLLARHERYMPTPAQIREASKVSYVAPPSLPEPVEEITPEQKEEMKKLFRETAEKLKLVKSA